MKKSKAETAETRRRIVDVASQSFRSKGIEATGVAEIMAAAGLTHGGFYRHFESKDELVAEAIATSLDDYVRTTESAAQQGSAAALRHALDYLSTAHRDNVERGCPLAATASELVRTSDTTRHVASEAFKRTLSCLAPFMRPGPGGEPSAEAISVVTNMIGALIMSRVVDDAALSDQILQVARERLQRAIAATPAATSQPAVA